MLENGESYQFALTNYEGAKSPRDSKVRETVLAIVEEFFRENEVPFLLEIPKKMSLTTRTNGCNCTVLSSQVPIFILRRRRFANLLTTAKRLCGGRSNILRRSSEDIMAVAKRTCGGLQKIYRKPSLHH